MFVKKIDNRRDGLACSEMPFRRHRGSYDEPWVVDNGARSNPYKPNRAALQPVERSVGPLPASHGVALKATLRAGVALANGGRGQLGRVSERLVCSAFSGGVA